MSHVHTHLRAFWESEESMADIVFVVVFAIGAVTNVNYFLL